MLDVELIIINNEVLNKHSRECVKAWSKKPTAEMLLTFCTGCRCVNSIVLPKYAKENHIPIIFLGNAPYEVLTYRTDLLSINSDNPSSINKILGYLVQLAKNPAYLKCPHAICMQGKEFLKYGNYNGSYPQIIRPFFDYIEWKAEDVNEILIELNWEKEDFFTSDHRSDCYIAYLRQYYYKKLLGYNDLDIYLSLLLRKGEISYEEVCERLQKENVFLKEDLSEIMEKFYECDFNKIEDSIEVLPKKE